MRSVYENLRVCRLQQENLELYFRQTQKQQLEVEREDFFNNMTVKYGKEKNHFSNQKPQQSHRIHENDKESRELEKLIEYESESSLNETHGE